MLEKDLQHRILDLLNTNKFVESITNQEKLNDLLKDFDQPNLLPVVTIDSYLERRYVRSVARVLKSLEDYKLVSGDRIQDISLQAGQRLLPDILLANPKEGSMILLELKRSQQSEREAITQLMAYAQEVANHLPLLSSTQMPMVLIGTDFTPLLDHALASLVMTKQIPLLALRFHPDTNTLSIHFPEAWTAMDQGYLPPKSLVGSTLTLTPKPGLNLNEDHHIQHYLVARDLLATAGAQGQHHGFMYVWQPPIAYDHSAFHITLYCIDPFVWLPRALEKELPMRMDSPLAQYILNPTPESPQPSQHATLHAMAQQTLHYLGQFYDATWQEETTWDVDFFDDEKRLKRTPHLFHAWGILGDISQEFTIKSGVRKTFFPNSSRYEGLGETYSPFLGLRMINYLADLTHFQGGRYTPSAIFSFGIRIRITEMLYNSLAKGSQLSPLFNSYLFWHHLQLAQDLWEIELYAQDIPPTDPPRPSFPLFFAAAEIPHDFVKAIESYCAWFEQAFLFGNMIHQYAFDFGWRNGLYFDSYFGHGFPQTEREWVEKDMHSFVLGTLQGWLNDLFSLYPAWPSKKVLGIKEETLHHLHAIAPEEDIYTLSRDDWDNHLHNLSKVELLALFRPHILPLLDEQCGTIQHLYKKAPQLSEAVESLVWIKSQAQKFFDAGKRFMMLTLSATWQVGLAELPEVYQPLNLPLANAEEIYLQRTDELGITTIKVVTWEYVEELLKNRKD